jgi:AraC-like DNA-binding protein
MLKRLRHAVEVDRRFLDPALSLPSLARELRLSPQHVSRLVNSGIGCSFNDYLNRLRVEEACRILAGPDGPTRKIGAVAYDCGFGSASVFYAAFRKFTGRTPSGYLKSLTRT